jgi:hypothetical protein
MLYGWEKDGKFYLSAFREPRMHDGKRPAIEVADKATLETAARQRGAELVWQADGNE